MRLRWLAICFILIMSTIVAAQDFNATATAIIGGATQTAQANVAEPTETPDSFQATATALVLQATQTAEASTGNTAVPVTAQNQEGFELTATALIIEATQTANAIEAGSTTESETSGDNGDNALSITAIIVGAVIAILTAIGGALGLTGNKEKNG